MATLVSFNSEENHVSKMKDGDVGIIISWEVEPEDQPNYIGRVVQRYDKRLIQVGRPSGEGWYDFFEKYNLENDVSMNCQVRILREGDTIVL